MNLQSGFVGGALMVAGMVALGASAAHAQTAMTSDPGFYVTGSAGLSMPRDSDIDGTGFSTEAALENGWGAFLGAGYGFANGIRGELEFGHLRNDVDSVGGVNATGDAKVWSAMANVLYDFRMGWPVIPYVGAGIGVARLDLDGTSPIAGSTVNQAENAFAWQAMAGLGYALTDQLTASLGYKYFAIPEASGYTTVGGTSFDSDYASHNVLVGLRYAFGAPEKPKPTPVAQPAPAPTQPAPPPPAPQVARNYIVFFDWDSSVLTEEAKGILRTAADNAKRVAPVRINATGHADRSGPDGYNMALSLRRANAVKAELVRLGIPESEIAVGGRGEAEPLVATADGIREPQNRRVQIVLQ